MTPRSTVLKLSSIAGACWLVLMFSVASGALARQSVANAWHAPAGARDRTITRRDAKRRHAERRRAAPPAANRMVHVVLTTIGLADALTPMPKIPFGRTSVAGLPVIHVEDSVHYQRITGFGAAMTDTSAWLLATQVSPPIRQLVMNALFSSAGIHLDFVRVPIGASDFTAAGQPYSYDDLPAGRSDPQLSGFSIAHDQAYIIPILQQMLAINGSIQVLATPWSAPPWMKSNAAFDNLGGQGTLPQSSFAAFANYFVKFIQAYGAQGIPISAITPDNEPGAVVPYPGMTLSEPDEATFIAQYLAPALNAAGLHPKLYGVDRGALLSYAQSLLGSQAASDLAGISWHCYGGLGTLASLHQVEPSVDQIVSECSPGIIPYSPAEVAISSTRNWASAVALWNLALDLQGGPVQQPNTGCPHCSGVVTVSEQTHAVTLGANFYQFGQISKFVQPGAIRIGSERFVSDFRMPDGSYGVTPGLDDVAFLNPDGSKVLVAYNGASAAARFVVEWHGQSFPYTLARGSTVTFTWN